MHGNVKDQIHYSIYLWGEKEENGSVGFNSLYKIKCKVLKNTNYYR